MKDSLVKLKARIIKILSGFKIPTVNKELAENLKKNPFRVWSVLIYTLLLITVLVLNSSVDPTNVFEKEYRYGTIVFYTLCLYTLASLRIVGPKELGCRLLFGRPLDNVPSGLTFVPLWLCQLVTETRLVIQDELPAEPEKIYRGGASDEFGRTVPKELQLLGMKPPIRVTFSDRNQASKDENVTEGDPYDSRLTAEVVPVVRWRIDNFVVFLQTIGSVEKARKQMEDTCVKTFTELLTKVSPAVALLRIEEYSKRLQKAVEKLVKTWGVEIENAQIKSINFSQTLNAAVQDVVVKERKRKADILEGEGRGGREKAILDGRTDGFKKMMTDLEVRGETVIGAETARAIAGEGDKSSQRTIIAGSGGFTDLIGTATAIAASLRQTK